MKKKSNKRLDFLPNRLNKYSIRKFTVGTASILVGATLIFGAGHDVAKAAETNQTESGKNQTDSDAPEEDTSNQTNTSQNEISQENSTQETSVSAEKSTVDENSTENVSEEQPSTDEKVTEESTTEQPSTEEKVTEESTTEQPSTEEKVTEESTTEQPSTEEKASKESTTEQPSTEEKASKESTTEQPSTEEKASKESTTEQPSTEEKASKESTTEQSSTEEKASKESTTEQSSTEEKTSEESATERSTVIDKDSSQSVQNISQNLGVSNEETISALNDAGVNTSNASEVDAIAALIQKDYQNNKNENPVATFSNTSSQATTNNNTRTRTLAHKIRIAAAAVAEDNSRIIDADAIANGYIKGQTDATNAANTLSGRAWVVDQGTPSTMSNGLTPVPDGTAVYMQWIDTDGVVSPIYRAHTNNSLSTLDGSQVGPGAYAFDLRQAYTDANGKEHKYSATSGQYYKLWIEDYQTKNGNTVTMLRQAGGFFPGSYVNSVTSNNIGQFPLIGTNMQRTGIYMGVKPTSDYMTTSKDQWIHDTQGPISNAAVNTKAKNTVSGQVWLETGTGVDLANSATGPNLSGNDKVAPGYTVVMSSLTSEGVQAYKAAVDSLPESERADAARVLLSDHPEYISATVYGETDSNGRYTLRFPDGTLNDEYMYGYVVNPNGEVPNAYSSFTSPQFRSPMANSSFVPQSRPGQNLIVDPMWYNLNFALVPQNDVKIDITNYNNTTKPAKPGDVAQIDLSGTQLSPLPTHIEWRDKNGNVVSKTDDITSFTDGEQKGQFTVPASAQSGDVYTVVLVTGGKDVGSDSFVVATDKAAYVPTATTINKDYGQSTTTDEITNAIKITDNNGDQVYPSDKTYPSFTVTGDIPDGKTPGTFNVPVTVTYPDGTTDTVDVPVVVGEPTDATTYEPTTDEVTKDYGTPTTEGDVTGAVTIPNYPSEKGTPTITVDDPSTLPDGNTPGTVNVPVTVTYPDGTQDHVTVPVTTNEQADNKAYEPTTDEVTKDYGTPTTEGDVTGAVTIPNYPSEKGTPTITV
ncbi:Rib/alpha-like domain-containing protein, partial [Staphylococcus haemolyticus]|uniref:Rib/alpha-like domain-containing protein n=1 Tax=Staphylococcus haemolyticus TaxID=1283 RepID=UPI0036F2F278